MERYDIKHPIGGIGRKYVSTLTALDGGDGK
jgi:hypothetical protein